MASNPDDKKVEDTNAKKVKRVRKVMSIANKMRVLEMLDQGKTNTAVGRAFGVNESTIRTIKKNEKAIRASASRGTPESLRKSYVTRNAKIEKMERDLHRWLMKQKMRNRPLSVYIIRQRASRKCKFTFRSGRKVIKFIASNGWLDRFKKRYGLYENKWLAEEADTEAAAIYPQHLKKLIETNNYLPQQVFTADEAALFWKRMPACTCLAKDERKTRGFKPSKDKLKVLLCANASGDFLLKPMLLHRFRNPCPLKKECKKHSSVFMKGNHRIWITEKLFLGWFQTCFVPEVKKYLKQQNLEFKVLLILDTAPTDKSELLKANQHVQVVSIPPKTTPLLQPMHLGVLKMLKMAYTQRLFDYLVDALTQRPELTVKEAWQNFSICTALTMVEDIVREMKQTTLNGAWQELWKEVVIDSEGSFPVLEQIDHIVASAKRVNGEGFGDIEASDIAQLLDSHPQKIIEKYFQDVLVAKGSKVTLVLRPERRLENPFYNSNHHDDSEDQDQDSDEGDPSMDYLLAFRQGFNCYPPPCRALITNLQTKATQSFLSASFNREREEAGPSSRHALQAYSANNNQRPNIQIVELWESDTDTSDEIEFYKLDEESEDD
ncbi:tigger transposable element-derived protein 1-like [Rhynchocyon petersi]